MNQVIPATVGRSLQQKRMLDKDEPFIIQVMVDSHAPLSFDSLEENVPHIEITLFALCLIQFPISDLILIL